MEQKFVPFDEVVEKLGISAERLNEMREQGQLRAYRDGPSWKFRGDEIQKMVEGGIPEPPPPSDLGLASLDELIEAGPLDLDLDDGDDLELELAEEDEISAPDDSDPAIAPIDVGEADTDTLSSGSELEFADLEDTVTAGEKSDIALDRVDEPSDPSDSILLSDEALGESSVSSPSTIIGKSELESQDADLELVSEDDASAQSDVRLDPGASDVLSSKIAGSGVLDDASSASVNPAAFEDIEELELDLAAESSRILSPEDLPNVEKAGKQLEAKQGDSDLTLGDELELAEDDAEMGSTDAPAPEVESTIASKGESESALELVDDDDLVLGGSEDSDITLDSGDSGINLAPSDSGLALDDISLDLGGSAILSSLSLSGEGSDPEISLIASDPGSPAESLEELDAEEDFKLTPIGEGEDVDNGDSSSQVIALDSELGGLGDEVGDLLESGFAEEAGEPMVLSEDFGQEGGEALGTADFSAPVAASAGSETPYTVGNLILLGSCSVMLFCGFMLMSGMMWNIWSWNEPHALNSWMLDSLVDLFKLG